MTDQELEEVVIALGMLTLVFFSTILIVMLIGIGVRNGKQDNIQPQQVNQTQLVSKSQK